MCWSRLTTLCVLVVFRRRCRWVGSQRGRRSVRAAEHRRQARDAEREAADQHCAALQRLLAGHAMGHDDHPAVSRAPAGRPRPLEHRVERRLARCAGEDERQPGEHEHDVRAEEVRVGVPARGQEQDEVQGQAERRRQPRIEPEQHEQPDRDLGQRHSNAGRAGERLREPANQEPARSVQREPVKLRADPGRRSRVQEARVGELLPAPVDEGRPEEHTQRNESGGWVDALGHAADANRPT